MFYILLVIYFLGCILALIYIRQHNYLCDKDKSSNELKMSTYSSLASWLYFVVEYEKFGVGELPDDLLQNTIEEAVPDCSKHFNEHLFID